MWLGTYQQLCLIYHKTATGNLVRRYSVDEGRTWGGEVALFAGTHPAIYHDRLASGMKILYWVESGTLKCRRSMDNFATWLEVAQTVASNVADETPSAIPAGGQDNKVLVVYTDSSGQLQKLMSQANGLPPYV